MHQQDSYFLCDILIKGLNFLMLKILPTLNEFGSLIRDEFTESISSVKSMPHVE